MPASHQPNPISERDRTGCASPSRARGRVRLRAGQGQAEARDGAAARDQHERRAWLDLMEAAGWIVEIEHRNRPS